MVVLNQITFLLLLNSLLFNVSSLFLHERNCFMKAFEAAMVQYLWIVCEACIVRSGSVETHQYQVKVIKSTVQFHVIEVIWMVL